MTRLFIVMIVLAACGGPGAQTLQLVNKTPRTIAEVYVFPAGSSNHGASRGKLAPGETITVKMKSGNVEVLATSETIQVDERTRDTMQAGATVQLTRPLSLIFHDSDQPPPDLRNKDAIGAAFRLRKPAKPEPDAEPEAPAPEAP